MRRRRPRASDLWTGLILVGVGVEARALRGKRRDATLSHFTRLVFRTDSKSGRLLFYFCWAALAVWFPVHISSESERHVDQP